MNLTSFVFASIALTVQQYADKYMAEDMTKALKELESDLGLPKIESYDFIVVGAGTAGCLLASRLSEKFTVLLLESGGDPVPATYNPYLYNFIFDHPAINNLFVSLPQFNYSLENGGITIATSGKMMGGSGSHNGNVYLRGSPHDYDNFARISGDESWAYKNVLKHFKSFENFKGRLLNEQERQEYYANTGPYHVETDWPPITESWFQSAKELGFMSGDANGFQNPSFTPLVKSLKNGERSSSYTAYIKPIEKHRKSLKVLRYSNVQKVLIDSHNRAYGVAYLRHGIPQIAHASKEVIISCGTFQSPMLLIKSGIGPEAVLKEAGIPDKSVLPGVGKNFRNHVMISLPFTLSQRNATLIPTVGENDLINELLSFQQCPRGGTFSQIPSGPQVVITSSRAKGDGEGNWPDIQMLLRKPQTYLGDSPDGLRISITLTRGKSSGEIGFNSSAYLAGERDDVRLAEVDFKLFTAPGDVEVVIEGAKIALAIMENTTTFIAMGAQYIGTTPTACRDLIYRSDPYWKCYMAQRAVAIHHYVGTCKMGKDSDEMAVVDSKLRVRHIKNLRVVDASVLPKEMNSNTNAAVMLVAEKFVMDAFAEYGTV